MTAGGGPGEIAAASGTQFLISEYHVDIVMNFGVVGGLTEEMSKTKVCIVEKVVHTKGERSFINTLVLNYVSDKIYTIGTQGYQDIMEQGIVTLDFVSQAKLNKFLSLNLKARNLLNPSYKLSRKANESGEKVTLGDYKKGINISLGVSCTF